MYKIYDKEGNETDINKVKSINRELYKKLVLAVRFNGGTIAPYYDVMYSGYNKVIKDITK